MKHQDGYIKFKCTWSQVRFDFPSEIFTHINLWRNRLFQEGLIGSYPDGIGFGNISLRTTGGFIISGSATGNKAKLSEDDYSLVTGYDISKNEIFCTGKIKASSESLTHAAIYDISPESNAVIHVHHLKLWNKYLNVLPTSVKEAEYGTTEMAYAIRELVSHSTIAEKKILIMGGHKEGILAFGKDLDEAGNIILKLMHSNDPG